MVHWGLLRLIARANHLDWYYGHRHRLLLLWIQGWNLVQRVGMGVVDLLGPNHVLWLRLNLRTHDCKDWLLCRIVLSGIWPVYGRRHFGCWGGTFLDRSSSFQEDRSCNTILTECFNLDHRTWFTRVLAITVRKEYQVEQW